MMTIQDLACRLEGSDEYDRMDACEDFAAESHLMDPVTALRASRLLVSRLSIESSQTVRDSIFRCLRKIPPEAVAAPAVELLNSDDPYVRNEAVALLSHGGKAAVAAIREVYPYSTADFRKFAMDVLAGADLESSADLLLAGLRDPLLNIVITAVEVAGRMLRSEHREQVEDLLGNTQDPMLTAACVDALAAIGNSRSLSCILARFPDVHRLPGCYLTPFLNAVSQLGGPPHLPLIYQAAQARGIRIGTTVLHAAQGLLNRHREAGITSEFCRYLIQFFEQRATNSERYHLLHLIGACPDTLADDFLARHLVENSDPNMRLGAIAGLARMGTQRRRLLLAAHMQYEQDPGVRAALAPALDTDGG